VIVALHASLVECARFDRHPPPACHRQQQAPSEKGQTAAKIQFSGHFAMRGGELAASAHSLDVGNAATSSKAYS